ncbi:hypothetical protein VTO42DRAFT_2992 [Malbranchea cinnamomea]
MSDMYEPLRLVSDTYPGVVPRVRAQGLMALVIAVSILWALVWLTYRAYQVCLTPNEVLVDKLGLDIPPTPEVTLEEIGSRQVRIAWKYPEYQNSIHKHVIRINGVRAGESKRTETAATILNLNPGHIYHICVTAVSAANFQTSSPVLHIRTTPASFPQNQDGNVSGSPIIQAYVPKPSPLVSPSAPVMSRELSGGQLAGKRASGGRKQESPAQTGGDISRRGSLDDAEESLEQLAARLKSLQEENENLDKQIYQEEKEHESLMKELEEQRNELRQRVKEKDEASGDLRKHVSKLESVNRTAQNERNKRERLLQQKEAERQKRKEDIIRWEAKLVEIKEEQSKVRKEKARIEEDAAKRMDECRAKIANEQAEMKALDEDIKVKGSRIKQMEDERRRLEGGDNEEERELDRLEKERERLWEVKLANLRAQYASLISVHAQAQQQYFEAQERLKWVTANRTNTTYPFPALPSLDPDLSRRASSRRGRHRGSLPSDMSSPAAFPLVDTAFINSNNYSQVGNGSPTFPPGSAFFNINNGMTIHDLNDPSDFMRTDSGNPPMSPRADALLPSDLLGDGDEEPSSTSPPSSNQLPNLDPSAAPFENLLPGSRSPESSNSRSPSIFASPHGSQKNTPEDEGKASQEQKSVTEGPSEATQSTSRRLSGLFGFNRQRGKTVADGPPLLGSLKSGQSQSFPRNLDQDFDPIGTRRRRLSYTSGWANPMNSLFPRSSNTNVTSDSSSDRIPASRKLMFPSFFSTSRSGSAGAGGLENSSLGQSIGAAGYNQFSPRHDPIDPSILGTVPRGSLSPRPSSTYSFDNHLPKPSGDTQPFGWPTSDKIAHRSSPLGVDWSSPTTWSRSQSRRPSFQHGSSHHLPLGLPVGDVDFFDRPYEFQRPVQAPIGTRPPSSHRPSTPKLNPAAPSFKTLFGKKQEKSKNKENESSKSRDSENNGDDVSPAASRRSKDSRSMHASTDDSLERITSNTPSESVSTKESFIQKITRKGSSSKFNMPWKDRSGLFSKKSDSVSQGDVDGDGTSEMQLGKSIDSTVSSTFSADKSSKSSLSFSFMRKSKKDRAASECSEKASETGDDDASEA